MAAGTEAWMTGASGRGKQLAAAAIGVTVQGPMQSLAGLTRWLERAGVDSVWTGDYFQSGLVRAAVLGAATSGALVGTHVLQAFARSPLATALAAQDLQELTAGRFGRDAGSVSRIVAPYAHHWCIRDGAELARHRALAAAHGVDRLMLLVPADAADPARVTAHEQALADLLAAGDPPGLGPEASSPPPRA